jgi:hypothetical protein
MVSQGTQIIKQPRKRTKLKQTEYRAQNKPGYSQLIVKRVPRPFNRGRRNLKANGAQKTGYQFVKEKSRVLILYHIQKLT